MEQYISKSVLAAEINKLIERAKAERVLYPKTILAAKNYLLIEEYNKLLSFLDTLEVKEVNLDKVFNDEYSKFSNDIDAMDYAFPIDLADYRDFAKHFFELGLKAQKGE